MTRTQSNLTQLRANRKQLLAALQRVGRVITRNSVKPILQCIRLEVSDGMLRLSATDLDVSLTTLVEAEGELSPCLVSGAELTRRVKAGKDDICSLGLNKRQGTLTLNGGTVEHRLNTLELAEFPVVPDRSVGSQLSIRGQGLRSALTITLAGTAREMTRYAIGAVLLEADGRGARLVATDGRRMAIVDLNPLEQEFTGQVLLPKKLASLVTKLINRKDNDYIRVAVEPKVDDKGNKLPAKLFVAGRDWLLTSEQHEGNFPVYRDVVPVSASQFVVDRLALLDTLEEVAIATDEEPRGVQVDLRPRSVKLSAKAPQVGESSGTVKARFQGGGDPRIITAFNPAFLRDALTTLSSDQVIIDVGQNRPDRTGDRVCGKPAIIHSATSQAVRWVVMPVSTGLKASPETLGSNYEADEESGAPTGSASQAA